VHDLVPGLGRLLDHAGRDGAVVVDVMPGKAGAAAGLQRYDVVVSIDGEKTRNGDGMIRRIARLGPGASVRLEIVRGGKPMELSATLGERGPEADPEEETDLAPPPQAGTSPAPASPRPKGDALGLVVEASSRAVAKGAPARPPGVTVTSVVGLDPGTDAIEEGDVVLEVNRQETPNIDTYRKALAALPRGERAWVLLTRPGVAGGAYLVGIVPEGEE
jgi:serine protease Do